jgi:TonB-dependent starch-binding outer membrane protein SusC
MSRRTPGLRLLVPASTMAVALVAACHHGPNGPKLPATGGGDSVQVGYGTQSRRNVVGAISSIDGDTARRNGGTMTSMFDMLEGRVAGLEVRRLSGGTMTLRIRGSRSLLAGGEPLLVVDGIPVEGAAGSVLADMDPRDVQRIEVLKDAGSLAAYGSRGANGVLLVTMKKR